MRELRWVGRTGRNSALPRRPLTVQHRSQGHLDATQEIGDLYHHGRGGVAKDSARALAAYKIGAEGGHARCQGHLGTIYKDEGSFKSAEFWLEKGAAQDDVMAMVGLATMHQSGQTRVPSIRRALGLFKRLRDEKGIPFFAQNIAGIEGTPLLFQRVEISGTSRNGERGVVEDFHQVNGLDGRFDISQSRFVVLLDSGKRFKVPMAKLRAEQAGGAGGARPKAKGKGKKGQGKGGK